MKLFTQFLIIGLFTTGTAFAGNLSGDPISTKSKTTETPKEETSTADRTTASTDTSTAKSAEAPRRPFKHHGALQDR